MFEGDFGLPIPSQSAPLNVIEIGNETGLGFLTPDMLAGSNTANSEYDKTAALQLGSDFLEGVGSGTGATEGDWRKNLFVTTAPEALVVPGDDDPLTSIELTSTESTSTEDEYDGGEIIVTGTRPKTYDPGTGGDPGTGTPGDGDGGGGESGGDSGEPSSDDPGCVEAAPSGAPLSDINAAAKAAATAMQGKNDWNAYEYSAIIYISNGLVGVTTPYTDGLPDAVNWLGHLSEVPDGATIVGIVHSHPDHTAARDTIPSGSGYNSGDDWDMYDRMIGFGDNGLPRGIKVDENMLLYITSDEDGGKVHAYDNTDKNQTTSSCPL